MPFLTQGKTNWKFLLIVIVLAVIAGGGILVYLRAMEKIDEPPVEEPVVKEPETLPEEEVEIAGWQTYRSEEYGIEFKYPQDYNYKESLERPVIYFYKHDVYSPDMFFSAREEPMTLLFNGNFNLALRATAMDRATLDRSEDIVINFILWKKDVWSLHANLKVISFNTKYRGHYYTIALGFTDNSHNEKEATLNKMLSTFQFLEEVEKPEIWRLEDPISNVEIIARENRLDKDKTDIYINNLKISKESFYITLSNVPRVPGQVRVQFRNGHLYIGRNFKREIGFETEIWKYLSPEDDGTLLFSGLYFLTFNVLPNESFMVVHHEAKMEPLLTFINLNTGEQKNFDFYDLAAPEAISHFEEQSQLVMEGLRLGIYGRFRTAKWSPNFRDFWGFVYLHSTADPPVPEFASVFKINVSNWEVEKFALSRHATLFNYISPEALNIEREMVLFEQNTDGGLALYLYNLRTKEERIIVSYPKATLDEYRGFLTYVHSVFFGVEEQDKRCLSPKWIDDNTISYFDFETREKITKKIE